ncbi:MAG: glycosyltransferase [Bacillaceae bacterium]|nr:glycosyltransferase [Bacillaceae bacterium]
MKKKVLVFTNFYVPSVKGGGPIQSIKNLVDNLSDKIDFFIVTSDRDLGDNVPFENIKTDEWNQVRKARVFYTNPKTLTWKKTINIINSVDCDVIYLNSFFSYRFSIIPVLLRKIKRIPHKPIVLAPRGEFSTGALSLKFRKKKLFIRITQAFNIHKNITWHATTATEKTDIEGIFGKREKILVANNLTANYQELNYDISIEKEIGKLKIVFISRIHPKKNLKSAIEYLKHVKGQIQFNIYGPIEDQDYWLKCQKIIESLPENIKVSYKGIIGHERVIEIFKENHVFLFPTLGENFGHVISEALIGGCPLIISDQTPWRDLESKQVGWDISLTDEKKFVEVLQQCVELDHDQYQELSRNAFEYGKLKSDNIKNAMDSYGLFE